MTTTAILLVRTVQRKATPTMACGQRPLWAATPLVGVAAIWHYWRWTRTQASAPRKPSSLPVSEAFIVRCPFTSYACIQCQVRSRENENDTQHLDGNGNIRWRGCARHCVGRLHHSDGGDKRSHQQGLCDGHLRIRWLDHHRLH